MLETLEKLILSNQRIAALEAELAAERERRAVAEADKDRYLNLVAYHEMQYHRLQHESEDELAVARRIAGNWKDGYDRVVKQRIEIEEKLEAAQADSRRYKQVYDAAIAWQLAVNANDGPYDARTEEAENFAWNCFLEAIDAAMNAERQS